MAEGQKLKSVGIIGAGPSGLIAAHHFLNPPGTFSVTIFEKTHQICGLWPTTKHDDERMIDPRMRTNQSKHTMQFGPTGQRLYQKLKEEEDEDVDVFPRAWQVGRYLTRLCDEVTAAGAQLELNTEVVSVEEVNDGSKDGAAMKWRVKTRKITPQPSGTIEAETDGNEGEEEHVFDHLVIASGFFGTPKIPSELQPYLSTTAPPPAPPADTIAPTSQPTSKSPLGIPVIHSSSFGSLSQLLGSASSASAPSTGSRKILIVGGSMSGAEAASAIASELSSLQHSPGTPALPNPENYEVIHIAARPFWTFPRYLPLDATSSAPTFLPLDFVFLNLVTRPPETRGTNRMGDLTPEAAKKANEYYSAMSGQEKPHGWVETDKATDAPWLAICDDYTTHAACGNICTFRGRLASLSPSTSPSGDLSSVSATIETPLSGALHLDNIAAVILATGFSSTNSVDFISSTVKQKLLFKPDSYVPLQLSWESTISPSFPTLGFVGMYNGPYWGVMEQQALILRDTWAMMDATAEEREEVEFDLARGFMHAGTDAPALRQIEEREGGRQRLSQFPMGDYVHVINELMSLRVKRLPDVLEGAKCWPLIPDAVELAAHDTDTETVSISEARQAVQQVVGEGIAGKFYPRTLFRALLGQWSLQRTVTSKHPSYPSGTLSGTATFHPRTPTSPEFSGEYLFSEEGDFKTDTGLNMRASRRYVWRLKTCSGEVDKISQWFVKVAGMEKNVGVDYLFHELEILQPGVDERLKGGDKEAAACPRTKVPTSRAETPDIYSSASDDHGGAAVSDGEVKGGWATKSTSKSLPIRNQPASEVKEKQEEERLWRAKGHHLCIDDTYDPEYVFRWKGAELESWTMAYTVKGPGKDYFIESRFRRPVWE